MRAIIVGAGIGGLTAAVALHRIGVDVTVLERSHGPDAGGTALSIWPNALAALDELDLGDRLRDHAALGGRSGIRRPDGRWLARSDIGAAVEARFGAPLIIIERAQLIRTLLAALPSGRVRRNSPAVQVSAGDLTHPASLHTASGVFEADLVVAADGIRSVLRPNVVPEPSGPRYLGYTAWRMLVPDAGGSTPSETWGAGGHRFAILPISGDRCYCYATATVPARTTFADEADELRRRFGAWHEPIPRLLATLTEQDVVRDDIEELPPLPAMHLGRVALLGDAAHAMSPDLGQGGCQAIEDAVVLAASLDPPSPSAVPDGLERYTAARLPRTTALARASRRAGALYGQPLPVQRLAARLMGLLPASVVVRGLAGTVGWRPPPVGR